MSKPEEGDFGCCVLMLFVLAGVSLVIGYAWEFAIQILRSAFR